MSAYPALFREYILESTKLMLSMARAAGGVLSVGDRRQLLHILNYALDLPDAWLLTRDLILVCTLHFEQTGPWDEWATYLAKAIYASRKSLDLASEAQFLCDLGTLYQLRSQYEAAQTTFLRAADSFQRLLDARRQARALHRAAAVATSLRRFEEANHLANAALALLDEQDPEIAQNHTVRAFLAYDAGAMEEAAHHFTQALHIWEQAGEPRMVAFSLLNLGTALRLLDKFAEAIAFFEQAIAFFTEIDDVYHTALARNNLGNVFLSMNQPLSALELFQAAEKVFREQKAIAGLARVYNNQGVALRELQQYSAAERFFYAGLERWEELKNIPNLVDTMAELAKNLELQGRYEPAEAMLVQDLEKLSAIQGESGYHTLFERITAQLDALLTVGSPCRE
jgi:tetratricopeptide (TPR) repeat protein